MTFQTFKIAVNAVSKADIVSELPSPMIKQAIAYIDGIAQLVEEDGKDPATWADGIMGVALSHRLSLQCDPSLEAEPSSVPKDKAWDVCKRTKEFLKGHGHASQPKWFAEWKAALDAEKEAAAKVEAAAKEVKTNEAAAKEAAARASSPAVTAGVEPPTVTTGVPPATGGAAVQVGQMVRLPAWKGKLGQSYVVEEVQTKHSWVLFVNGQGVKTGGRKRVMTDKL